MRTLKDLSKASTVILEMKDGGPGLAGPEIDALKKSEMYVVAEPGMPFELHKQAGGIEKYLILGQMRLGTLWGMAERLTKLNFEVYLLADFLFLTDRKDLHRCLEVIEKQFSTQRWFAGDFMEVVLARISAKETGLGNPKISISNKAFEKIKAKMLLGIRTK